MCPSFKEKISEFAQMILKLELGEIMRNNAIRFKKDLDCLGDWASRWQMQFSVDKCKIIMLGTKNQSYSTLIRKKFVSYCGKTIETVNPVHSCSKKGKQETKLADG